MAYTENKLPSGLDAKTTPIDADVVVVGDSADTNRAKKTTWANVKATLKTYFDTLYNNYTHPNHSGDVTSVADGATTITDDAVTNAKLANVATSTIKGRSTAGTGDPEDLTATQVRTLINVEDGADVTNTTNVTAAGALMNSELADLTAIKTLQAPDNTTISAFGATLIDDADAPTALGTLGLTATAAEINTLDGITSSTAELNILDGVTATAAELNVLDGITATTTELNYTDGVTSAIQTQIDGKPTISSGAGAPATTPSKVGDIYIDTTGDDAYIAVGTASSSDWEKSNDGTGGGGGAFTDLSDTPANYTSSAGKAVRVNGSADGLEFADFPSGTGDVTAASSFGTNNVLVKSDGIGKGVQATGISIADTTNNVTGVGTVDGRNLATDGAKLDLIEANADVTDAGNVGSSIHGATAKTTPVDADTVPLIDSEASNVLKKVTWANVKATLKTYFDTLYNNYTHPNHTGDVTSTGDGATVIANGAVTLAKQANVDTSTVFYRKTAGAGAPEVQSLATLKTDLGLTGTNSGDQTLPTRDSLGLDTDDTPQFAGIELGHPTDTTLSRSEAGVLAVEGVVVPTISSTNTLTNKRITKRTGTVASSATPTINTDNVDEFYITAQTEAITSFTTNLSGSPTSGQGLFISITGTAARAITWGASFSNGPVALPTTTVTTTALSVFFRYDGTVWRCMATGSTV